MQKQRKVGDGTGQGQDPAPFTKFDPSDAIARAKAVLHGTAPGQSSTKAKAKVQPRQEPKNDYCSC